VKFFAVLLLLCTTAAVADSRPDAVVGRYWLPQKDGQLEIYAQDDRYFGRIVSYDVEGQLDVNNPDLQLQSRPVVGIILLSDFQHDKDENRWTGGTIYDAKSGKTYRCRLWFDEDEPGVLWARGYIGISLLGRTERFERFVK
jgi:uncharacterized protein (DUF2147 family)